MKKYLYVLFMVLLTACSPPLTVSTLEPPITTEQLSATLNLPKPSSTTKPTIPPSPTITPTRSPSQFDGLRMAYLIDNNLYFQDGGSESGEPIQLTDDEEYDLTPVFSDDGEKIVFLRGIVPHDLYSINPDGSQEQLLVSYSELSKLGLGYNELSEIRHYAFVPGTHQLIFNTRELGEADVQHQDFNRLSSNINFDLLLVDADTGEIRVLLQPGQGGVNFAVAPDGSMIAVLDQEQIDLFDLNGQIIRRNLISVTPTQPFELYAYMSWVEDGSELIVTVPVENEYDFDGPEFRTVWRIAIDGSYKTQVDFDPPLLAGDYWISPDGKWILHSYYYWVGKTDENVTPGVYLNNFTGGSSQLVIKSIPFIIYWNPNSYHYLYSTSETHLAMIDGQPVSFPGPRPGRLLGWVDDEHVIFLGDEKAVIKGIDGTIIEIPILAVNTQWSRQFTFVYVEPVP